MNFKVKPNPSIYLICLALLVLGAIIAPVLQAQPTHLSGLRTIVIDPGHGGKDPGCLSANKQVKEKTICLSVALKLGKLIQEKYPEIRVIYTRSTDVFIPLDQRAAIANKNYADLFLSIHVNATASKTPSGTETFVMGTHKSEANMAVCRRENHVIIQEDDYSTKYEGYDPNSAESFIIFSLLQNSHLEQSLALASCIQKSFGKSPITINRGVKQGGLLVLWKCSMPACLTEIGFLSNYADAKILTSKDGQNRIARKLLDAIGAYKNQYEASLAKLTTSKTPEREPSPKTSTPPPAKSQAAKSQTTAPTPSKTIKDETESPSYRVQIFATTKEVLSGAKDFKGHKNARMIKAGKYYKYTLGDFPTKQAATEYRNILRKDFPQCFVIRIQGSNITPYYNE